ncbi:hypothetical protein NHX12_022146 [Muraenolepis orangiensis]|uniref:Uncharacterized protein n=1 Tax=Muraenolepis orangiensis TaxID=630683 RepID=A0A9Q0ET09_9TELE|nr:hypothetical protein NHX12_022146 [Muraenolepis orangiensis]
MSRVGPDAPESSVGSGVGGGLSAPISDDLDIFGPMVSNPLPSGNTQSSQRNNNSEVLTRTTRDTPSLIRLYSSIPGQVPATPCSKAGSVQADPANPSSTKAEEKKTLSKDSILSLYTTSSMAGQTQGQHQPAAGQGMYMGQMQYANPGYNVGVGGAQGMMLNGGYMAMGQGMLPPGAAAAQGHPAINPTAGGKEDLEKSPSRVPGRRDRRSSSSRCLF